MKIAISAKENKFNSPFESSLYDANYYLVIDTETSKHDVIKNEKHNKREGKFQHNLKNIISDGVDVLISGKCDEREVNALFEKGIRLYHGWNGRVDELVNAYKNHTLQACTESNYLFNMKKNYNKNIQLNKMDMTEIIAGFIPDTKETHFNNQKN